MISWRYEGVNFDVLLTLAQNTLETCVKQICLVGSIKQVQGDLIFQFPQYSAK